MFRIGPGKGKVYLHVTTIIHLLCVAVIKSPVFPISLSLALLRLPPTLSSLLLVPSRALCGLSEAGRCQGWGTPLAPGARVSRPTVFVSNLRAGA